MTGQRDLHARAHDEKPTHEGVSGFLRSEAAMADAIRFSSCPFRKKVYRPRKLPLSSAEVPPARMIGSFFR
jgi:hypothetical protein